MNRTVESRAEAVTRDARWAAVVARDVRADGDFFYSVRTTGVFCRPSCGARTPRPENVGFHPSADAARQAGFRACKRCEPEGPSRAERHTAQVAELCRFLQEAESPPSLEALARRVGWSPHHLHRVFKAVTGLTPKAYAAAHRAERVREGLARGGPITDTLYAAGYNSSGPFYESSDALLGMTPSAYRAGGADMEMHFAVGECSLGALLVAESARGICAILLGDGPLALTRELEERFPHARRVEGDAAFARRLAQVIAFVEEPRVGLTLPLDVRGTAFQQRVWRALRDIPVGTTESYAALARRLGAPGSARAVAQACGANALAVLIPCHRVVRGDGQLAGYRWGIERKRALLERERTETSEPSPRRVGGRREPR